MTCHHSPIQETNISRLDAQVRYRCPKSPKTLTKTDVALGNRSLVSRRPTFFLSPAISLAPLPPIQEACWIRQKVSDLAAHQDVKDVKGPIFVDNLKESAREEFATSRIVFQNLWERTKKKKKNNVTEKDYRSRNAGPRQAVYYIRSLGNTLSMKLTTCLAMSRVGHAAFLLYQC